MVRVKTKVRVRLAADLVSEEDRFYVRVTPIVQTIQPNLTENQINEIIGEVKKELAKELNK